MTQNVCLVRLFGQNKVSGLDAIAKSLQATIFCIRFCIKTSQGHIIIWGMDCIRNRREDLKTYF